MEPFKFDEDPSIKTSTPALKALNNAPFEDDVVYPSYFQPTSDLAFVGNIEGYGRSKYDTNINPTQLFDLGEVRAQRQTTADKWANATGKMLLTAGTTFLDGTLGTVYGIGTAIGGGSFVDNAFSNTMADISEWQEQVLPNYYTKEEVESPWYTNLGTANFWADKMFKNLGFTVGAVYSGMAWSGAAGALLNTGKVARNVAKGVATKFFDGNVDQVLQALKSGKINPEALGQEFLKDAKKLNRLNGVQQVIGATTGAVGESRIEAINNAREFEKVQLNELDAKMSAMIPQLEQEAIGKGLSGDAITEYVDARYNTEKAKLGEIVDAYRNVNFAMDFAVLSAGNYGQFKKAFGGGYDVSKKTLNNVRAKAGTTAAMGELERDIPKGILGKSMEALKTSGKIAKNSFWEGFEEFSQGVIKDTGDKFYGAKFDPDATDTVQNYFGTLTDTFAKNATNPAKWEEFFIGFMTGAIGVPIVTKSGTSMSGGVWETLRENKGVNAHTDKVVESWNQFVTSDRFKNNYLGAVRDLSYQNQKDKFLEKGDVFNFKNAEHNQFINDVVTAVQAERFDELVDFYNNLGVGSTPEMLRDMLKVSKDPNGVTIPVEERKGAFDNMSDEEVKSYFIQRGNKLAQKAKEIRDIHEALEVKFAKSTTAGVKENLLYMMATISNSEDRLKDVKSTIGKVVPNILLPLDNLLTKIVEDNGKGTEESTKLQEEIEKSIEKFKKTNPTAIEDPLELVRDAIQLTKRRVAFVSYYNDAITSEGQKKIEEYQAGVDAEVNKMNEILKGNSKVINDAKKLQNKDLEAIYLKTISTETITTPEEQEGTKTHRGEVELTVRTSEDETRADNYQVEGVNDNGELVLRKVTTDDKGNRVLDKNTVNIGMNQDPNTRDAGYIITGEKGVDTWVDMSVSKTSEEARKELIGRSVQEMYAPTLEKRSKSLRAIDLKLTKIKMLQAKIAEKAYSAIDNKSGKTRIRLNKSPQFVQEMGEMFERAGIDVDLANKAVLIVDLVQLNAIYKALEEMRQEVLQELSAVNEEVAAIQKQIAAVDIDSIKETHGLLVAMADNTQSTLVNIEEAQVALDTLIKNIKRYLKGLDTRLETLRVKKDGKFVVANNVLNHLKVMLDSEEFGDTIEGLEEGDILNEIIEEIKYLQDTKIPAALEKLAGYEQKKEDLQKEYAIAEAKLKAVAKSINERVTLLNKFYDSYVKNFDFKGATIAGDTLLDQYSVEDGESIDHHPPMQPFTGNVSDFMRSSANHEIYLEEVIDKKNDTFESELLFQDFVDTYEIVGNTDKNYKYLQGFSLANFLTTHGDKLTANQRKRMEQDAANYPDAVMVVVVNKDGSLYTMKPLLPRAGESLVYSKINGVKKDGKGVPINERSASGYQQMDVEAYKRINPTITEDGLQEKFITTALEYEKTIIKPILDSKEPTRLEITGKTPGKNVWKKGDAEINIKKAVNVTSVSDVELVIAKSKVTEGQLTNEGFVYFKQDDVLQKASRQLLSKEDSDKVIDLLKLVATKNTGKEAFDILQAIDTITLFQREKEGRLSGSSYRFYVATKGTTQNAVISEVVFGVDGKITKEELLDETKNPEAIKKLKEFLGTKFYNVRSKDLVAPDFISKKASLTVKDGKVTGGKIVDDKVFKSKDGGYLAYLLEEGNEKIKARQRERKTTVEDRLKNPTKLNRSINFDLIGKVEKVAETNEQETKPKVTPTTTPKEFKEPSTKDSQGKVDEIDKFAKKLDEEEAKRYVPTDWIITDDAEPTYIGSDPVYLNDPEVKKAKDITKILSPAKETVSKPEVKEKPKFTQEQIAEFKEAGMSEQQMIDALDNLGTGNFRLSRGITEVKQNFNEELEKFREIFPDIVVSQLGRNAVAAGIDAQFISTKSSAAILISTNAANMSLFHEGWHVVTHLFTSPEERTRLYNETRNRLGKTIVEVQEGGIGTKIIKIGANEMSDAQAEEYLAEEFRTFMIVGKDNYKFPESSVKKSIFQRIWDAIKRLILPKKYWNNTTNEIEDKFNEITTGTYHMQDRVVFENTTLNKVGNLTEKTANSYNQAINHAFFNILQTIPVEDKYTNLSKVAGSIYILMKKDLESINSPITKQIIENWDLLKEKHINYLKQYNIKFDIEQELTQDGSIEDVKLGRDNSFNLESNKTNFKESLPAPLKLVIAGLPRMKYTNGVLEFDRVLGLKRTVNYGKTLNLLSKSLANLNTIDEMVKVLVDLSDTSNPELKLFLERLGIVDGKTFKKGITREQFELQVSLFIAFHKSINDYTTIGINPQGDIYLLSNTDENNNRKLRDSWKINAKENSKKYPGLFKLVGDKYILDKTYAITIGKNKVQLQNITGNTIETAFPKNKVKQAELAKEVLSYLGIQLSPQFNDKKILLGAINNIFPRIKETKEPLASDDLYNKDIIKANKELKTLVEMESKLNPTVSDLQIIVSGGQVEYALMDKNRIAKVIDSLNGEIFPSILEPFNPSTGKGNIGTLNSVWIDEVKKGLKINKTIIRNVGEDIGDKTDISEASPSDFIRAEFNSVLEGVFPFIRSAERKLEYAFDFGKTYINTSVSNDFTKGMMKDYLEAELVELIAINNSIHGKKLTKRSAHKTLGVFKDMFPELAREAGLIKKGSPTTYLASAKKIMAAHKGDIEATLDEYIIKSRNNTLQLLTDNKIVIIKGKDVELLGLNPEIQTKFFNNTDAAISLDNLDKLVDVFNHYYIGSLIEQSKLIFGSPLVFLDAKKGLSALHKRTTTFASTITGSVVADSFHTYLNENFKRMDGYKYNEDRREVTIKDLKVDSIRYNTYKKILVQENYSKAYLGMTKNDGQGTALPDGYRSFAIRTGLWNVESEKSWQYSMQISGQKFVDTGLWTQDRYNEVFKQHFPKVGEPIKGWAYYEGNPIGVEGLVSLPNLKPQGTGVIKNEELVQFNSVDITKTSITLLNPIDFLDNPEMLKFIVHNMNNGVDFIYPESAKKGEIIADDKGNITNIFSKTNVIESDLNITEIGWDNIGNQLDIDPAGKTHVTMSTQMRRLQFIDVLNNGLVNSEFSQLSSLHAEYTQLQRELVERSLEKVIGNIGLSESTENEYKLVDNEKFFEALRKQFEQRQQPANIVDGLNAVMEANNKVFDTIPSKIQVVNALQGLIRNKVVTLKFNGDMLTQESAALYEPSVPKLEGSNYLKFYRLIDANGKEVDNIEDAIKVLPAQAMITLPKAWIPFVLNEFTGVNFEDKLAQFNEKLKDPNWKYYKQFKKINTYVANRIPAQHLNSIEVLEVVKFLHPVGGSKVVLPTEIVAKSGSDFDIDKLTSYFNNIYYTKEGLPQYAKYDASKGISENSREALENRLNEIAMSVTLDKNNFRVLIKPNNSDIIKEQANIVDQVDRDKVNVHNQFEFHYNSNVAKYQWGSNRLVAVGAINAVSHAATQANPIKLDNNLVRIGFTEYEGKNEGLFMGHNLDNEDNVISDTNGAILTAAVDAGKETFPNIFRINLTMSTANAYFFLNRVGNEEVKPMGFKFLTKFFTQPIIIEYETQRRNEESKWLHANNKFEDKKTTTIRLINKYIDRINSDITEKNKTLPKEQQSKLVAKVSGEYKTLNVHFEDYIKASKENAETARILLISNLDTFQERFGLLNEENMKSNPQAVLEYFLYYQELGKLLGQFHTTTRHDAGLPKDVNTVKLKDRKLQRLENLNVFDKNDIENLFDNSYIGAYKNAHDKSRVLFKDFFLLERIPALNDFIWGEDGIMSIFESPLLAKSEDDLVEISHKVQNALMAYILHTIPMNGKVLNTYYKELFTGANSLGVRLNAAKGKIKDNIAVDELIGVIKEFNQKTQKNTNIDFVKLFNKRFTVEESNSLTDSIKELFESIDPELQSLGNDLIKLSILQSGVQRSPVSFFEVLPAQYYHNVLSDLIDTFIDTNKVNLSERTKDIIFSNLNWDTNIVPRQKKYYMDFKGGMNSYVNSRGDLVIPNSNQNSNYPYLSVEDKTVSYKEEKDLKNEGKKIPKETTLFKRANTGEKVTTYVPMNKMGAGYRMFEVSPTGLSIVSGNNTTGGNQAGVDKGIVKGTPAPTVSTTKVMIDKMEITVHSNGKMTFKTGNEVTVAKVQNKVLVKLNYNENRRVNTVHGLDVYVLPDNRIISLSPTNAGAEILNMTDDSTTKKRNDILNIVDARLNEKEAENLEKSEKDSTFAGKVENKNEEC